MSINVLKSIDFKRLQIFLTVVECGGFAAAQDKLGIGSASISLHMTELERRLGMVLCKRGRSGFSVTPEGEKVLKAAQSLMMAHSEFNAAVGETRGILEGELCIGMIDQLVHNHRIDLAGFLNRLNEMAPQVRISLSSMSPSELTHAVISQDLHLGIGVFYDRSPHINYHNLCDEKLALYCGSQHRLFNTNNQFITVSTLKNESFIERTFGETLPVANRPLPLKPGVYSSSLETTLLLILTGNHIGFLSDYYAQSWLARKEIRPILENKVYIPINLTAITHQAPEDSLLSSLAIDTLQNFVRVPTEK